MIIIYQARKKFSVQAADVDATVLSACAIIRARAVADAGASGCKSLNVCGVCVSVRARAGAGVGATLCVGACVRADVDEALYQGSALIKMLLTVW